MLLVRTAAGIVRFRRRQRPCARSSCSPRTSFRGTRISIPVGLFLAASPLLLIAAARTARRLKQYGPRMITTAGQVAFILGGIGALGAVVTNLHQLRLQVEAGLPVESLDAVARRIARNDREVAEIKYRIVPKTTLARRRRLTLEESERLERLARITALAEHVWEDLDNAHEFLQSEQKSLGDARPIDLARTELGAREVEDLLMKMEYSLPG